MAIGALGILGGFAGGAADAIQEGEKLRLQNNADQRAQEMHVEELKKAQRENFNAQEMRDAASGTSGVSVPDNSLVYNGSNFSGPGYGTYAEAAGTQPSASAGPINYTAGAPAKSGSASVRYNNPGAMWPNAIATRFGATGYQNLNDGQGNKIAIFPDGESGAAAHFALLNQNYTGMPLSAAIRKWSGGNSSSEYTNLVSKATGLSPDTVLTPNILASPQGIVLAKAMARQEAGGEFPLSDAGWQQAQARGLGLRTAAINTGTATDASTAAPTAADGGPKFVNPDGTPKGGGLPGDSGVPKLPDRLVTSATGVTGEAQAIPTAKLQPLGKDETVIQDPATGRYHRVPTSDTRPKNAMEMVQDLMPVYARQGKLDDWARIAYNTAQTQTMKSKLDMEQVQRQLAAAQGDPESLAKIASAASDKLGAHLDVVTKMVDDGQGHQVPVLGLNMRGTNAGPMYYDRNGQLSATPDTGPGAYQAGVAAIQDFFAGDTAAHMTALMKFRSDLEQTRIKHQEAEIAAAKAPAEIETEKGKPALQRAQTANLEAEAQKNLADVGQRAAQTEAQRHENYGKAVATGVSSGAINLNDPEASSKQMGILATAFGIKPAASFVTKPGAPAGGSPAASPFVNSAAGSALPGPAAPAAPAAPATGLPGLPAPIDNSSAARAGRFIQQMDQEHAARQQALDSQYGEAAWRNVSGPAYDRVREALYRNKTNPDLDDVRRVAEAIKRWPQLKQRVAPEVAQYVKQYAGK